MDDLKTKALAVHAEHLGKLATQVLTPVNSKEDLSLVYTPGVAEASKAIAEDPENAYKYTIKPHTVAIVSDGSAVLGLGNIGGLASIPVMEGKAALFKTFANIDAFPICLKTQEAKEIIEIVKNISPVFGAVNLEDITAPKCFEVEEALQDIGIPVMHDDQHGTAVVVLAGLINASKVVGNDLKEMKVVVNGAGAAGSAVAYLIYELVSDVIVIDTKGAIYEGRENLDPYKEKLAKVTNKSKKSGTMQEVLVGADVFIGVSKANLLTAEDVKSMNEKAIIFALANPTPEIMPEEAKKGGAYVIATGRSDFPNQVNNALAFPGIFKGVLEMRATRVTKQMKIAAAKAIASVVINPTSDEIIPSIFDKKVVEVVCNAVKSAK